MISPGVGSRSRQIAFVGPRLQPLAHVAAHAGVPAEVAERPLGAETVRRKAAIDDVICVFVRAWLAGIDAAWQKTLGQFVALLEPLAFDAHQFAFHEQLLQGELGRLPIPPAAALLPRILEVTSEQRPFGADAVTHPSAHCFVAAAARTQFAAGDGAFHRQREAVVAHRQIAGRVTPVLERTVLAHQTIQRRLGVLGNAREKRVMVRPRDHGDGIDLHVAQLFEGLQNAGGAGADLAFAGQPLVAERQIAQASWASRHRVPTRS